MSQHNQAEQRKIHNAISEVTKGDCIIMGDFNHGNIKSGTLESTGVEDQKFVCLVQDNFLTQQMSCIRTNQNSEGIIYSVVFTERIIIR